MSEFFRYRAGLGGSMEFIDLQLATQLQFLDENGMYMDNKGPAIRQPMQYDLVPRGLFAVLLACGYRGQYYEQNDDCVHRAALCTLDMQSTTGEAPYGGRSNQFLHNEPWLMTIFEYEASRYAREGDDAMAEKFKAAIACAMSVTQQWLSREPIRHIKNRFATESGFGCEDYAYFDKYMITVASFLYTAYLLCDDSIPTPVLPDRAPTVFKTSEHFHKLFLKSGGYALEFDTNADPHYDAGGLGRVHREGAPSAICLSCPCPATPSYTVDLPSPIAFSACSAVRTEDGWLLGADRGSSYDVLESKTDDTSARATLACHFENGRCIKEHYTVDQSGVTIVLEGDGEIGYTLPAFYFDGESTTDIVTQEHSLTVCYEGWMCRYTTDGTVLDLDKLAANRNGHYRVLLATANTTLNVKIQIIKE